MFWKKKEQPKEAIPKTPRQLTLNVEDDDITRAVNMLKASGMSVNELTYTAVVPWMAHAIRAYREMDREKWENENAK